ncbi:unnamed protein product [Amoebophrya sp. A25]|nr:unnamed protein product [Amoebophrya sp. A25]|eukprot:GSA25T00025374001.1
MAPAPKRRVLVIGGGFSGLLVARDLNKHYEVTVVDAKEFFEYTPGILRAYVKPCHFDALTFTLSDVVEKKMGCKFIWGEVLSLNGQTLTATVQPMCTGVTEELGFDYCVICSGCNFNFLHPKGESLWFPTVHECGRQVSEWKHIDERYLEGRRRHILEEYQKISDLNKKAAQILICGAGFIGVEWATELQYFFPKLKITVIDFLPNCLGPLPVSAQEYCDKYMQQVGIKTVYGIKYEPKSAEFWQKIGLSMNGADETYICMGVKASNYFMPKETLSDKGPGGGGWIYINKKLQVTTASGEVWGKGVVFAAGDCNYGCVGSPSNWQLHPIPKISYPSEEQATQICKSIEILDNVKYGSGGCLGCCMPKAIKDTWWPWGAGMFATSLGPHDACFVIAANHKPKSGVMCVWGWPCAIQKELIETTKVDECQMGLIGLMIWHFVHHTPVHLFGDGRFK